MQVLHFSQEINTNCYNWTRLEPNRGYKDDQLLELKLENKLDEYKFLGNYCKRVKDSLSAKRYRHVLGVTHLASEIAIANKFSKNDYEATVLAAFLHDIAKELAKSEMFALAAPEIEFEKNNYLAVHGRAGRKLAEQWGISNLNVLEAIEGHVLGVSPTNRVAMAVYIADVAEPGRGANQEIGELALKNLFGAYKQAIAVKLNYLKSTARDIHPHSIKIYEEICDFK